MTTTTHYIDYKIKATESRLRAAAEHLATRMTDLVGYLDNDRTINSLGEVQGAGMDVDRLCGELAALKDVRDDLLRHPELGNA